MQEQQAPRRRRWPLVLIALVPVLAGLWAAGWYYAAGLAERAIAGWREREARAGRIHTCGSQAVAGFPFRFELRCSEPAIELKSAERPLSIKAKDMLVTARLWQPTRLTGTVTGPLTIADPGQPPAFTASWRHAEAEVRGLPISPDRVTVTVVEPLVERSAGAAPERLFAAARVEVSGRMLEGSAASNPVIETGLKLAEAVAPGLHPATGTPLNADINAVLRGLKNFAPKPWPDRFREVQQAGGRIEISHARLQQGDVIATTDGALGLSPQGRPDGQLRLTVANLIGLLPLLGLDGRTPPEPDKPADNPQGRLDRIARQSAGPALVAGLNFIGQPAEIDGKRALTLPLRFADGLVTLGPIPLGRTPPLF